MEENTLDTITDNKVTPKNYSLTHENPFTMYYWLWFIS